MSVIGVSVGLPARGRTARHLKDVIARLSPGRLTWFDSCPALVMDMHRTGPHGHGCSSAVRLAEEQPQTAWKVTFAGPPRRFRTRYCRVGPPNNFQQHSRQITTPTSQRNILQSIV